MKSLPAAIVVLGCSIISMAQDPETPSTNFGVRYEFRRQHDPNGIGKFYLDREIARVMGFAGAAWLERNTREQEERLSLMVKSLKLKAGDVVADIGAGSGVISMLMAEQILPRGKVMAVDIQKEMLLRLKRRSRRAGIRNIKPVKGTVKSPNLKPESVDLAIMVDVYHEFEFPYEMMLEISRAIKPGGRVVLVEYRMEDPTVPIKLVHKMSEDQVIKELSQPEFSLKWGETVNVLPWQHILVFTKQNSGS
ncbi:MAG: class I SAM-dependent methyltransferase [Fuerstiella sp.]|nr:class I SAM-dependent methyltransferase [Fuerstiella sp.]